jgi:hypothetical protein
MTAQLNLFGDVTQASTSVLGLLVTLPAVCTCGATEAAIGSSAGPHFASLHCSACGKHRGWVSAVTFHFIADVIDKFGRPSEPISVTFKNSRSSSVDM